MYVRSSLQTLADLLPSDPSNLMYGQVLVTVVSMQSGVSDIPHARFEEAKKLYGVGSGDGTTCNTHPINTFTPSQYIPLLKFPLQNAPYTIPSPSTS